MNRIELSFSLTKGEAREGIIENARGKLSETPLGIVWRFGKQLALCVGLSLAAAFLSQQFGRPDPVPEMFSLLLGAAAIMSLWQFQWSKGTGKVAEKMARFSEEYGPTIAVFDQGGIGLASKLGTVTIPWRAIDKIRTTKNVTLLMFGAQILVVPHRILPSALAPLDFDSQLEEWKAAA